MNWESYVLILGLSYSKELQQAQNVIARAKAFEKKYFKNMNINTF